MNIQKCPSYVMILSIFLRGYLRGYKRRFLGTDRAYSEGAGKDQLDSFCVKFD
jgi:hypothetical protein